MTSASRGRLFLVRHGESRGNRLRQFSRDNDIDLTDRGVEQAQAAGRALGARISPGRIVASPYFRTRRTAALIAEMLGFQDEIELVHDLHERNIGELAGKPYESMRQHPEFDPERFWEWRPGGGESLADVMSRVAPVIEKLLEDPRDTVVVTHGGVMLAVRAYIEGRWSESRVARNAEVLVVGADERGRLFLQPFDPRDGATEGSDGEETG